MPDSRSVQSSSPRVLHCNEEGDISAGAISSQSRAAATSHTTVCDPRVPPSRSPSCRTANHDCGFIVPTSPNISVSGCGSEKTCCELSDRLTTSILLLSPSTKARRPSVRNSAVIPELDGTLCTSTSGALGSETSFPVVTSQTRSPFPVHARYRPSRLAITRDVRYPDASSPVNVRCARPDGHSKMLAFP